MTDKCLCGCEEFTTGSELCCRRCGLYQSGPLKGQYRDAKPNTKHPQLIGNQLYVICTVCGPEIANTLHLAARTDGPFQNCAEKRVAEKFFKRHETCGGTKDHFKLALGHAADLDLVVDPATNVKGAVKL